MLIYVLINKDIFYKYCTIENNLCYIIIQEKDKTIKYFIDDYIENINTNGFLGGFIEINAISNIYNVPITITNKIYENKNYIYKQIINFGITQGCI